MRPLAVPGCMYWIFKPISAFPVGMIKRQKQRMCSAQQTSPALIKTGFFFWEGGEQFCIHHSWESFHLPFKWPSENTGNRVFAPHELWISLLWWLTSRVRAEHSDSSLYHFKSQRRTSNTQIKHTHTRANSNTRNDEGVKKRKDKRTHEKLKAISAKCLQSFSLSFVLQFMEKKMAAH